MSDSVTERTDHDEPVAAGEPQVWQMVVERIQHALDTDDDAALISLDDELRAVFDRPRREIRKGLPQLKLYQSLIKWKRGATFEAPFDDAQTAKIQFWDLDAHCSDLEYKRRFADAAATRYPERRGFRLFQSVLTSIGDSRSQFKLGKADVQIHRRPGAKMTVIGFGAIKGGFAGIGWDLFDRAVVEPLGANLIVLQDFNTRIYLAGIQSLGDYATSVAKVREIVEEFADTRIVATGASGGVFGAINFAADLGVRHIVAFAGPTSIEVGEDNSDRQIYRRISADIDAGRFERVDLAEKVNQSAIERIDFFVAGLQKFDMDQLNALRSRCDKVHPHIYEKLQDHVVTDYAIRDGSIFTAFRAGPETPGLA